MKTIYPFILSMLAVLMGGCAALNDMQKKDSFEETTTVYAHSMRWSDFEMAMIFVHQPGAPEADDLKNIKITSYEVKQHLIVQEGTRIRQVASISYFKKTDMLVKTVASEEVWEFSETDQQWFLVSGFPRFE